MDEGPGLEDANGHRVVLVTSDFQGVPKEMSDPSSSSFRKKFGLERQQVMFTFSHNHCGPRLGDDLVDYYPVEAEQVKLVDEYTALMVAKVVEMVGEALSKLAPASLRIGEGKTTFAVNRRNNREADVPAMLAKGTPLAGPVDHAVPVMTVTRPDGSLAAILFGYACHPTTLSFIDVVRRLSRLRQAGAGTEPSRRDGHVRQHLRRRSEPAAAAARRTVREVRPHAGERRRRGDEAADEAGLAGAANRVRVLSSCRI